jgi:hypothetical protein
MEGLHTIGDILTKISVNCVINLHVALLFTCLFLWVLPVYAACICYCYFSMNPCNYRMYLSVYVLCICFCKSSVCIYILIACSLEKFMWHNSVGC